MGLRRSLNLRPVRSEKHEITWTFFVQNASATQSVNLIQAVEDPTTSIQVNIGATVKWIYLEFNLNGVDNSGASMVVHWQVHKNPTGVLTFAPLLYNETNRRFILKRGMEMLPEIPLDSGGTVQTKRIMVIKIPPRLRRFGENDRLVFSYQVTSASGINICGIVIYKAFE